MSARVVAELVAVDIRAVLSHRALEFSDGIPFNDHGLEDKREAVTIDDIIHEPFVG